MSEKEIFCVVTSCAEESERAGVQLAQYLLEHEKNGAFAAMYGDLGAGKTAFVRGAASVIAPGAYVQSPTYTVVNEYRGANGLLFHFDMYRIDDEDSLDSIGYWDYLVRGGYLFVEWSEKIPYALPDSYYRVEIVKDSLDEGKRTISVKYVGDTL